MEHNSPFESFELQISSAAQDFLKTAAGWAMFLSIVGFIILAFSLLGALGMLAMGSAMDSMPGGPASVGFSGGTFGVFMLIYVIIMFFPVFYLFRFSTATRQAVNESNTEGMTKSFSHLKNYFLWSGLFTIFLIVSYIALIVVAIGNGIS
jgi:hypothetical protein